MLADARKNLRQMGISVDKVKRRKQKLGPLFDTEGEHALALEPPQDDVNGDHVGGREHRKDRDKSKQSASD